MMIFAIYKTNNKADEFPNDIYADTSKLPDLINSAVEICSQGRYSDEISKKSFGKFLERLLEIDIEKRPTAKDLLQD